MNTNWQHGDNYTERMLNLPLNAERQKKERMANNPPHSTAQRFSNYDIPKIKAPDKAKDKTHSITHKHEKRATFTFISPQIRRITDLFRNTNVKVAFRCHNTIGKLIRPPNDHDIPPHNKWGIYK